MDIERLIYISLEYLLTIRDVTDRLNIPKSTISDRKAMVVRIIRKKFNPDGDQ